MTILAQDRRSQLSAGGTESTFSYSWKIFEEDDLDVFLTPEGQEPNDNVDKLSINVIPGYTVQGVGEPGGSTVTITPIPALNDTITIQSDVVETQDVNFTVGGPFDPDTVEFVIDKLTVLVQENESLIRKLGLSYDTTNQLDKSSARGDNRLPQLPPSSSGVFPVWTKNAQGELIAGELREAADCSTLRGELADQSEVTPGAAQVGFFDPSTLTGKTVNDMLISLIGVIQPAEVHNTGDMKPTFKVVPDLGWLLMDDGTIGNAASGATNRANADTEPLFLLLWDNVIDAFAPVSGGRGATAIQDFNTNKTINLPLTRGRVLGGAGSGAGLTSRPLGDNLLGAGEEDHTLTINEIPNHLHFVPFSDIPGNGIVGGGSGNSTAIGNTTLINATGPLGQPHNNMQPSMFPNWLIKL